MSNGPNIFAGPDEAVRACIQPGEHLHFASAMARPHALMFAVARQFRNTDRPFPISIAALQGAGHALTIARTVAHATTCFAGENYPVPKPCPLYTNSLRGDPFTIELWSLLSFNQRLTAAAMGMPYALTRSLVGSSMERDKEHALHRVPDPVDVGNELQLVSPLTPDVCLLHAICADEDGNLVLCPPLGEGAMGALAARRGVIASVEKIVPRSVLRQYNDRVIVPGHRVIGLCEAPWGAHPQGLRTGDIAGIAGYQDDYAHLEHTARACQTPEGAEAWFEEWVAACDDHQAYLDRIGRRRLDVLSSPPFDDEPGTTETLAPQATEGERLIALAVRAIVAEVERGGYRTLLAGIGAAHIASWLAAERLRERGVHVRVLAELGYFGQQPAHGDPFLFSLSHANKTEQLAGIHEVLGSLVGGGNNECLGILGAAEVDLEGRINSTATRDGSFIVGSGGANDIASTTDCLVIARARPHRYVKTVSFATTPGHRIQTVVSQFGKFKRNSSDARFELSTWLPISDNPELSPIEAVHRWTDWSAPTANCWTESPITVTEREQIRTFDPQGFFSKR